VSAPNHRDPLTSVPSCVRRPARVSASEASFAAGRFAMFEPRSFLLSLQAFSTARPGDAFHFSAFRFPIALRPPRHARSRSRFLRPPRSVRNPRSRRRHLQARRLAPSNLAARIIELALSHLGSRATISRLRAALSPRRGLAQPCGFANPRPRGCSPSRRAASWSFALTSRCPSSLP
jgi:hypothetical protein